MIRPRLLGLIPVLVLACVFALMPPDGQERSSWLLFVGRFHLLTIHFPIALLYLVPILEIAGRYERLTHLKAAVEFVLVLAMLGSLVAATLGWCLARNGSYSGRLITQHMWGGVCVAAACWVCWMLREQLTQPYGNIAYVAALALAVALVSWTGYRGGQLTQGENHLTEGMPSSLRSLLGIKVNSKPYVAPDRSTFYGARIEPILSANCYSCHGADKQRGELQLDSYAAIMRGGKHGKVIQPGNAKASDLFHRITLPQTDDNAMPPQGKRSLTAAEIKLIELWISTGASDTLAVNGIKDAPTDTVPVAEVTFEELDPAAVERTRAAHASAVIDLEKRYPNVLEYESRTSAGLTLNASLLGMKFGDADIALLKPVLDQITTADFSGTAVSDSSATQIASMKNLHMLRLMHTRITDATVQKLSSLPHLESLNLLATPITPAALKSAANMPKLRHLYIAETKITPNSTAPEALKDKLIF